MLQLDSLLGYSVEKDSRHWLDLTANRVRVVVEPKSVDDTVRWLAVDRRWTVDL